jgi:hypothetical protein
MGLRFEYPPEFESLWSRHPVGVKKLGYDAWKKLKLTAEENAELAAYLERRHRDDEKWVEGKYVPHLSTFLNGRRWEDNYRRIRRRESTPIPSEVWQRMGYASFDDYCKGRRAH